MLYGHGTKPQHLSVDARQFGQALHTDAGTNVLISLEVGQDEHLAGQGDPAPPGQGPPHPRRLHPGPPKPRRSTSRCRSIWSKSPGVREGGIADQDLYQLNVEAEVTAVPEAIEADVSGLGIGDVCRSATSRPSGAVILDDFQGHGRVGGHAGGRGQARVEEAEEGEAAGARRGGGARERRRGRGRCPKT